MIVGCSDNGDDAGCFAGLADCSRMRNERDAEMDIASAWARLE